MKRTRSSPNPKKKRTTTNSGDWERTFAVLRQQAASRPSPSLNVLTEAGSSPWQILVSTILSLRTRDEVTLTASRRLFSAAPTAHDVLSLEVDAVAELIYPAAFYKTKARQILSIAATLPASGHLPRTREELLAFPGVGRKTANLVLNLAYGIDAICVDTHVHRIPNRLGWIATKNPEESEKALEALWPRRHWIESNELFVSFGQSICTPLSPRCSICPFRGHCERKGVGKSR